MSFSLAIVNGDLSAQGGQLATVKGAQKLLQDLASWVLTRMGSDQYQPGYGSLIDGGTQPNGVVVTSPLGSMSWTNAEGTIQQEIVRIITLYQSIQNLRMQDDMSAYGKPTLTPDEILTGVTGINFQPFVDQLIVSVDISTAANQTLRLQLPIQTTVL